MPDQTPLNPDPLDEAINAAHSAVDWGMFEVAEYSMEDAVEVAVMSAVSAYLAALPEVPSDQANVWKQCAAAYEAIMCLNCKPEFPENPYADTPEETK